MREKIIEYLGKNEVKFSSINDFVLFFANRFMCPVKQVRAVVEKMIASGELVERKNGKLIIKDQTNLLKGKIIGNAKGFAFCQIIGDKMPDFFIPPQKLKGALNGDIVLIKPLAFTEESQEAEVVKILEKANKTLVGTLTLFNGKDGFVIPDNKKISKDIFVSRKNTRGAKQGERVVVEVDFSKKDKLSGVVVEVLGQSEDVFSLEMGIIRSHKLYEEFPENVIKESQTIPQTVSKSALKNRKDLRDLTIFTIDGADAKDLDDAVSISKNNGNYYLGVHIADVGHYVKKDSILDKEAYLRGTSAYFPNMVLPMLPRSLSNGICSLNPHEDRLTLSVFMEIDKNGEVVSHEICESVINSKERLTYDEVHAVIMENEEMCKKLAHIKSDILLMNELSQILEQRRKNAGALDLDIPEPYVVVDKDLNVEFVEKRERNESHKLIENFMVVCNETVAKHFANIKMPFVYRIHEKPLVEKIRDVCAFLVGLGVATPEVRDISPKFVQDLLKLTEGKDYYELANKVVLRSLQKAKYFDECLGHFGLALEYYCHFTSPIRRYPDLCIHRIIKESLHGPIPKQRIWELSDFVIDASFRSSETEKNAEEAERDVDDLFKAVYMKDHLNEEFVGTISGVQNYGFYVELDNTVEGLVRIENLPQDNYLFFEKSLKLKGNSHTYCLGDKVKVKAVASNVFERKIDFVLVWLSFR